MSDSTPTDRSGPVATEGALSEQEENPELDQASPEPAGRTLSGADGDAGGSGAAARIGAEPAVPSNGGWRRRINPAVVTSLVTALAATITAAATVAIAAFMLPGFRSANEVARQQRKLLVDVSKATTGLGQTAAEMKRGVTAQRQGLAVQKATAAAIEEAVTKIDELERSLDDLEKTIEGGMTKTPIVEAVRAGARPLSRGGEGTYLVTGCPQLRITVRNPGGVTNSGVLTIDGRVGSEPLSPCTESVAPLGPGDSVDLVVDLGSCLRDQQIYDCGSNAALRIEVKNR